MTILFLRVLFFIVRGENSFDIMMNFLSGKPVPPKIIVNIFQISHSRIRIGRAGQDYLQYYCRLPIEVSKVPVRLYPLYSMRMTINPTKIEVTDEKTPGGLTSFSKFY